MTLLIGASRDGDRRIATPISYQYDNADRLTQWCRAPSPSDLAHDDNDRRTTTTLPNGIVSTWTYNDANAVTGMSHRGAVHVSATAPWR